MGAQVWLKDIALDAPMVVREGASLRTADELKVCFLSDALDVLEDLHDKSIDTDAGVDSSQNFRHLVYRGMRVRSLHAEEYQFETTGDGDDRRLTRDGFAAFIAQFRAWVKELDEALVGQSGLGWFELDENGSYANTEMADPGELDEDLTSILSDLGVEVWWEDGYVITRAHPDDCRGCMYGEPHDYVSGVEWRDVPMRDLSGAMINHRIRNRENEEPLGVIIGIEHRIEGDGRAIRDLWVTVRVQAPGEVLTFENPMYGGVVQVEMDLED